MHTANARHVVVGLIGIGALVGTLVSAQGAPSGQTPGAPAKHLALTPPMGWNSWDSYGLRISEEQFRANVTALASKLKAAGYTTAVIDEGWYMVNPEDRRTPDRLQYSVDDYGRFIPVASRYPSALQGGANTGFTALGSWIHANGLRFGIHIIRGIPRVSVERNLPIEGSTFKAQDAADQTDPCPWDPTSWGIRDNAAGQAWYDSLLRQYAGWGVDFIKVDCIADHPYKPNEIRQIHQAIQHAGRDVVLSLSPGPTQIEHHAEVAELSELWRISNDVWDIWDSKKSSYPIGVVNQFANAAKWAPHAGPGHWPDADMLPVGELTPYPDVGRGGRHTRLTPAEQQTQMSLWAMARSPLIVGANLTMLDDQTTRLLTNPDIVRIDQTATASREALRDGALVVWTADLPGPEPHAVAVFNVGDEPLPFDVSFGRVGLPAGSFAARDVWSGARSAPGPGLSGTLDPHACQVFMITEAR
jgi:hypothetical protein